MFNKKKSFSLVLASTLSLASFAPQVSADTIKEGTVKSHSLTVRTGPGVGYTAKAWLQKGQKVTIMRDYGAFSYVKYGKTTGYVSGDYLNVTTRQSNPTSIGDVATVSASSLTVRTGPSASYSAQDWLQKGQEVTILKNSGTFSYIQYGSKKGYVSSHYLKTPNKQTNTTQNTNKAIISASSLTVRTGPSASYSAQDWLQKGQEVTILKNSGTFSYIQYGSKKGYVSSHYLTKNSSPNTSINKPISNNNSTYIVRTGDTLWSVSQSHGTTVANIKSLNNLSSNTIKVGQKLNVNGKASSNSNTQTGILRGKVIVLDPGHGGKFPGAQGIVHEEDVNLDIALKLRSELQRAGATVLMTRTSDVHLNTVYDSDLAARPAMAKRNNADMFISIHANAGSSAASGSEVYWMNSGRGDKTLAQNVLNSMISESGMKSRGAKYANFSVLRNSGSKIPSILIETGFVTNKHDASILGSSSGQNSISKGIANGIIKYFK